MSEIDTFLKLQYKMNRIRKYYIYDLTFLYGALPRGAMVILHGALCYGATVA
jgi:hypothetical protein